MPRPRSLPEFHLYESIYEEIGLDPPTKVGRPRSSHRHRPKYNLQESDQEEEEEVKMCYEEQVVKYKTVSLLMRQYNF